MKNNPGRAPRKQPWNRFQWQVRSRRSGRRGYLVLHVEKLETRSLLAGDLAAYGPACDTSVGPAEDGGEAVLTLSTRAEGAGIDASAPLVDLTLALSSPDGTPLTSLRAGQDFVLHVFGEDLRESPHGVFSAYFDLRWDGVLASVAGPLQFSSAYPNLHLGDASISGVIDEAGAFGGFEEVGAGPHEILSVTLRATGAGNLVVTSDEAETPINQVLVFGLNQDIASENVQFGSTGITIGPAPAGSSSVAASVNSAASTDAALEVPQASASLGQSAGGDELLRLLILSTLTPPSAPASSMDEPAAPVIQSGSTAGSVSNEAPTTASKPALTSSEAANDNDSQATEDETIDFAIGLDAETLNLL